MSSPFHDWSKLRDENDRARLDFIWTDLDVCLTFAAVVESEYKSGNREHAERTLASAEKAYSDTLRIFSQAKGLTREVEKKFQSRFKDVRERLDGLSRFR